MYNKKKILVKEIIIKNSKIPVLREQSLLKEALEKISLKGIFTHHQENLKLENYIGDQIG